MSDLEIQKLCLDIELTNLSVDLDKMELSEIISKARDTQMYQDERLIAVQAEISALSEAADKASAKGDLRGKLDADDEKLDVMERKISIYNTICEELKAIGKMKKAHRLADKAVEFISEHSKFYRMVISQRSHYWNVPTKRKKEKAREENELALIKFGVGAGGIIIMLLLFGAGMGGALVFLLAVIAFAAIIHMIGK